MVHGINSTC